MKVKLTIPEGLADIKLSQYQKFLKTTKDIEDVGFVYRQMVGIFCNVSDSLVNNIKRKDYDDIVEQISSVLSQLHDETNKPQLIKKVSYNGVKYGFIPKLDDITVGEQADIDSMINDWQKMDKVLSILYRPIKIEKRSGYIIQEYQEMGSLDLTMDVVHSALVFFYNLLNDLVSCTQSYIEEEVVRKNKETLEKNGVGINQYMESLEVTFLNLKRLLSLGYTKPYYL